MSDELCARRSWWFRNIANMVTGLRIKLTCVLLLWILFYREQIGLIVLLAAVALPTDGLDGFLARKLKIVSKFGAALDRFADKFFQFTMFLFFLLDPRIDPWLKGVICPLVLIEILLLTIWFLGVRRNLDVSSGIWGKAKMLLVSVGIIACPIIIVAQEHGMKAPYFVFYILFSIFVTSFFLGVMSFRKHLAKYRQQLSAG